MDAGQKKKVLEVRYVLFDYFFKIRYSFKVRPPQHSLLSKATQLYEEYCVLKAKTGEEHERLKIIQKWLQKWCKDYRISLKYPSKPFSKTQEVQKRKITQFLKSVCTARYLWKANYKVDSPIFFS